MAELNPETKIERLLERMKPLADWYSQNRPSCRVIRVSPDDLRLLLDNPKAAMSKLVSVGDGPVRWREFEIKSTAPQP